MIHLNEKANLNRDEISFPGMRVTDCCNTFSTFLDPGDGSSELCCKKCLEPVESGEGDGSEFLPNFDPR